MQTLIDPKITPVGGWRWIDPDNGHRYERQYRSYKEMLGHIFNYRAMNNLPPLKDVDATIFDWLCQQEGMERYCCDIAHKKRTWGQVYKGAKQITKAAILGLYCDAKTAEARAQLCLSCPYNEFMEEDIKYYNPKVIFPLVHGRSVSTQNKLYTCEKCMCILAVKVHHTHKEIIENLDDEIIKELKNDKPDCWQLKDFN